jgi:hypothetical protein
VIKYKTFVSHRQSSYFLVLPRSDPLVLLPMWMVGYLRSIRSLEHWSTWFIQFPVSRKGKA